MRGWQFSRPATFAREVTARLFGPALGWLLYGPRVTGIGYVEALEGPVLICPNHSSHFDFSAVRLALGAGPRRRLAPGVAADYFATSPIRWFFAAWLGAFAFNRTGRGAASSFEFAEALLAAGWSVLLFPEGTRSRSGAMGPFKPGIGLLATRTGRPVLPVRIVGMRRVLPPGARLPRRAPVEVRFGPPLVAARDEDPRAFTERLEALIRTL